MTTDDSRKRRRRRRLVAIGAFFLIALLLAWFFEKQPNTTIIIVRHAEVTDPEDANPGLNASGRRRARELARVIGNVNVISGVDAIFANEFRHSQQTVEPLAKRLELPVQIVEAKNIRGLRDLIRAEYDGKKVLVVTTPESITRLIGHLNGRKDVPAIAADEYDNLYIVAVPWYGKVDTLNIKYGEPYRGPLEEPSAKGLFDR